MLRQSDGKTWVFFTSSVPVGSVSFRVIASAPDYVDLLSWPPFNLADIAITGGVLVLVYVYLRDAEREPEGD